MNKKNLALITALILVPGSIPMFLIYKGYKFFKGVK
jgi:hypothetical protein